MNILIKRAELFDHASPCDVTIANGRIVTVTPTDNGVTSCPRGSEVIDALGALLLPGLNDHHIHLCASAAALSSLNADPAVTSHDAFCRQLRQHQDQSKSSWLRVINYHPDLAGDIDKHAIDALCPSRPVRVQHRGGRLWILNTAALTQLSLTAANAPSGAERQNGELSGRLFELDEWLTHQLASALPELHTISQCLAQAGVTGVTDTTPRNGMTEYQHLHEQQTAGKLLQNVRMMGTLTLGEAQLDECFSIGEHKIHLLESALPDLDETAEQIRMARALGRCVAFHCVTLCELVFALGAFAASGGGRPGDRIEHGSVIPDELLPELKANHLRVITQPHFIQQRGDQYLRDVDPRDIPVLYRVRGLSDQGIPVAWGSDSPYGKPDPWFAMRAAIHRVTTSGRTIGPNESLDPITALQLALSPLDQPGAAARGLQVGDPANLCLLDRPWSEAQSRLLKEDVRATIIRGRLVYLR